MGSFMPLERETTMLSAVMLMKRSRKASYISDSEWRLKFSLDYSSSLNTLAATEVRMLTSMNSERGLGL